MKLYPINFDCSKDIVINTRDKDVQDAVPLAKILVKSLVNKGVELEELVKAIKKQFPVLITEEIHELVIKPLIGVDIKYNDSTVVSPIKEEVKVFL